MGKYPMDDSSSSGPSAVDSSRSRSDFRPAVSTEPRPPVKGQHHNHHHQLVLGELIILGYNGSLPHGERGRRRSKFVLYRRSTANGVKKSKHYVVKQPQLTQAIQDKGQHSISYTLSRSQAVIVEYSQDEETDLFQIGRSSEPGIDFVVIDTPNPAERPDAQQQSTISRFACRILVERRPPYTARIYAAGFDSSRNIFLGEKATKWQDMFGQIDGLTTNGVLLLHPKGSFVSNLACGLDHQESLATGDHQPHPHPPPVKGHLWREVSVCGGVYAIRETRSAAAKGAKIEGEENVLKDGTLIDLCGATLLWRSAEGLKHSPTKRLLDEMFDCLAAARPQCPVGLNTLVIPRRAGVLSSAVLEDDQGREALVYLRCGHVQGSHKWGVGKGNEGRTCPMCLSIGPVSSLSSGMEASFYVDTESPNYGFNPCGHMASERSVRFWASVAIPHGTNGFHAMCPFCAVPLQGQTGFVRLIFQDNVD